MADFFQEYDLANLCICISTLISVDKCLDIAVIAVRSIISYCISVMFKKEGFYIQKMYLYINALDRIGTSVCSVKVVSTVID